MRYLQFSLMLTLSIILAGPVLAEGDQPGRGEFRKKMLKEFDANADGELSEDERATAREAMRGRRGKGGAEGPRRGMGPPDPGKRFDQFDANGDNQLSREEFYKLAEAMRERHAKGRGGSKGRQGKGRRDEGRGRRRGPPNSRGNSPGFPPKERRDFRLPGPLQNPGADQRGGGPNGPGSRGPDPRHPPSPDKVFDRFDKNGDDQLSREEFMELSEAMRELRDRFGRGRFGEGRGERPGPPARRGRDGSGGSDRRSRPPRSEFGDGTKVQPSPAGESFN